MDLSVSLGKLKLNNPITVASGTFGYGEEFSSMVDLNKIGAIFVKGLTLKPRVGNPPQRIVETAGGMLNAIGLQNVGVESFINDKIPFLKTFNTVIVANINGSTIEDYRTLAKILNDIPEVGAVEINLSCPNVKEGGIHFGTRAEKVFELTEVVRNVYEGAILVKLSPNVTDIVALAKAVKSAGADAVSVINTVLGMAVDVHTKRPILKTITGGLSGPAVKPIAIRMVHEIHQNVEIPILGMGGISNFNDLLEFMIVGATAISVGTANYVNPQISIKLLEELEFYMKDNKINSVQEIVGSLKN